MNITTQDGRTLSGTPTQIVRQMQSLAFGQQKAPYRHYVAWLIGNAERCDGAHLHVPALDTGSDEQVATELLAELVRTGLAKEGAPQELAETPA